MRELGFSKKWLKLQQDTFTTFRFQRRDKDWQAGEVVKVVFKPRTKERKMLGIAKIIKKDKRWMDSGTAALEQQMEQGMRLPITLPITLSKIEEARKDGFKSYTEMWRWLWQRYGKRLNSQPMNKLILEWVKE